MNDTNQWEATRSGTGITILLTAADGARRKIAVKKIIGRRRTGEVTAYNSDGSTFLLQGGESPDTSAEVASIAGELLDIGHAELTGLTPEAAIDLLPKIRAIAGSALGQRQ